MHLTFRNVNDAFAWMVKAISKEEIPLRKSESRNGDVIMVDEPVTITYEKPRERVLFNHARDLSPFSSLSWGLEMLTGFGFYGNRLRKWFEYDQLREIMSMLRKYPESGYCVLGIWDSTIHNDLAKVRSGSKDVPCNTHAYFTVQDDALNVTVCSCSSHLASIMLGLNTVCFSMLQEYIAAYIGVAVGKYHQFSNNVYVTKGCWEPKKWLAVYNRDMHSPPLLEYGNTVKSGEVSLVHDPAFFDEQCREFLNRVSGECTEPFLRNVVLPMNAAFQAYQQDDYVDTLELIEKVYASDWREAGKQWLQRRQKAWEAESKEKGEKQCDV